MLDSVRSAESVGSIYRSADCGRVEAVVTCGFTPNPLSTSKLAKTALAGPESSRVERGTAIIQETRCGRSRSEGVVVWALETVDGAVSYTTAPLPSLESPGVALVFGNEVTGVDQAMARVGGPWSRSRHPGPGQMNVLAPLPSSSATFLERAGVNDTCAAAGVQVQWSEVARRCSRERRPAEPGGAYRAAYAGDPPRLSKSPAYQRKIRDSVGVVAFVSSSAEATSSRRRAERELGRELVSRRR